MSSLLCHFDWQCFISNFFIARFSILGRLFFGRNPNKIIGLFDMFDAKFSYKEAYIETMDTYSPIFQNIKNMDMFSEMWLISSLTALEGAEYKISALLSFVKDRCNNPMSMQQYNQTREVSNGIVIYDWQLNEWKIRWRLYSYRSTFSWWRQGMSSKQGQQGLQKELGIAVPPSWCSQSGDEREECLKSGLWRLNPSPGRENPKQILTWGIVQIFQFASKALQ